LNRIFKNSWEEWVENAPDEWKDDDWITTRVPISVAMRYGQNQPVEISGRGVDDARRAWETDRQFGRLRYMSFAIASHLSYVCDTFIMQATNDLLQVQNGHRMD
jgi:hypothetical protein